jgi:solute carrier family 35 (GDP-fucose transporter), member C1
MTSSAMPSSQMVLQVIVAYWLVSISMVYLNKVLLSNKESNIQAPLFITLFQCVVSCIICYVLGNMGEVNRSQGIASFTNEWPKIRPSLKTARAVLPLSIIFCGMVGFNNLCLQYVEVSFYNVARCLSLVFNVMLSLVVLGKPTSFNACMSLFAIILGFIIGIDGEVHFSFLGTVYGVLASLFVSLSFIYTAKILPAVDNDKSLLIFYNNANAVCLLAPLILLFESEELLNNTGKLLGVFFWFCMLVASVLGFAVALVTVLQIKFTSPLTHNISGTAKAAVQSLLAFYIWGNPMTFMGVFGLLLVLIGSAAYTMIVMSEQANPAPSPSTSSSASSSSLRAHNVEDEEGCDAKQDTPFLKR